MPESATRRAVLKGAGALLVASVGSGPSGAGEHEGPIFGHGLLVQLAVLDLDRATRFYADVLGLRVTERRDDLQFVHLDCGVPGLQLGLSAGEPKPPTPGSVVLNFDVAGDVDVVRAALERKGVRFTGPTRIIPGKVRLAPFEDPDGYRLRLAGSDPPAPTAPQGRHETIPGS